MGKRVLIVAVLSVILSLLMIPFLAHAQVYKWTDDKGTIHFTDQNSNIPEKYLPVVKTQSFPKETPPSIIEEKPASAPATKGSMMLEQERLLLFSGVISQVGDSGRSIAVTDREKEMLFTVPDDSSIRTDLGQTVSLSELKNGRQVTIEYIKKGDENQARSIKISLLSAGSTNVTEENEGKQDDPGKRENVGEAQKRVWDSQERFKTIGNPSAPKSKERFKKSKK